ncbi:SGNH/GDSL hydrolase family protein [uncultured Aquimarina sp.]|uniref:SGNH/GDSL hydrolase family protein n=1 Tax=uncultured Aquimarina sp. TaxID=575652 RepID=UPI002626F4B9|nr:SGNH/GDSL hydrolase family protein [uncultured Aquimarina sp.]
MIKKINAILCILFILIFGCASDDNLPLETQEEDEQTEETKIFSFLALGDSYTIGQGVSEDESWPFQLKDAFATPTKKIEQLTVIARTGWTTRNLITAIEESNPQNHDLVSLLIGVNNQFQQRNFTEFQLEFNILLEKAISLATNKKDNVIVVSIPDYGVTPFGTSNSETIASEIDAYNAYIKQKCIETEIVFIDVTTISRDLGNSEGSLATDNLHPSRYQYSLWVERILPVVKEILK